MSEKKISNQWNLESLHVYDLVKISLNTDLLSQNFQLIKQSFKKIDSLEKQLKQNKSINQKQNKQMKQKINKMEKHFQQQKKLVEQNKSQLNQLRNNIGDDFMNKIAKIQQKTQKNQDIEDIVRRIESLNKFTLIQSFFQFQNKIKDDFKDVNKIKDNFGHYVDNNSFHKFQNDTNHQFNNTNQTISNIKNNQIQIDSKIDNVSNKVDKAYTEVTENTLMIKEINFTQIIQKLRKQKQEVQSKVGQLSNKLKKKVGNGELASLQKVMIQKIDEFISKNMNMADQKQTKQALLYLQKRINQLQQYLNEKNQQDQDALFATKKWMCGSCSKDLGKYQGKMGQFKPWSIFPCKQLNPQQTGGFGYLNYVQKISDRRGISIDDSNIQRLSKTFYQTTKQLSPSKKLNSTNYLSNYGKSPEKKIPSLRQEYFKTSQKQKEITSKLFRVKKDQSKQLTEKQKAKDF